MNQGCHGAMVEMQGTSSISHCVETGIGGLRRRGDQHQVDLVVDDQLLGDLGGAVRVGLRVLDDDLDGVVGAADVEAVLHAARGTGRG